MPATRTRPYPRRHRGDRRHNSGKACSARRHSPAGSRPGQQWARTAHRARPRARARPHRPSAPRSLRDRCWRPEVPGPAAAGDGTGPDHPAAPTATAESSPPRRATCRRCRSAARSAARPRPSPRRPLHALLRHRPAHAPRTRPPRSGAAAPSGRAVRPAGGRGAGRRTDDGSATSHAPHPAAPGTTRPAPPAAAAPGCRRGR